MEEAIEFPALWIIGLIVLILVLVTVFSMLFGVFIGRHICKTLGLFIWSCLKFGGLITGAITEIGIKTACDLIPF